MQMNFDRAEMISSYGNDVLNFFVMLPSQFLNRPSEFFSGKLYWDEMGENLLFDKRNVPKQKDLETASATAAGSVGLQVLTIVNLVVAGFMQMSLEELWLVINSLSFIVYLPLFSFIFPDNC